MEDDIILDFFEYKEDDFNFKNEKLDKIRINSSHKLFTFIYDQIDEKRQAELLELIEKFLNATEEFTYYEKKMFFKEGFFYGMKLMINYFNK